MMWNTSWNPQVATVSNQPVDWAAKAAEWARKQAENPPQQKFTDTVENETEMEDLAAPSHSIPNEWSAVTDTTSEHYNNNNNWNGADAAGYQEYYEGAYYEDGDPAAVYQYNNMAPVDSQFYPGTDPVYPAEPDGVYSDQPGGESYIQVQPTDPAFSNNPGFPKRPPPPPQHHPSPPIRPNSTPYQPPVQDMHHMSGMQQAVRRKALPAWIRDGLEKMDKGKKPGNMVPEDVTSKPRPSDVTGYKTSNIQRNKISGYSVLNDSGESSADEKEESEEEIMPKLNPVLFVKRSLTELLLEVTNTELRAVVMECMQQQQAIKHLDDLCKKKKKGSGGPINGLELVSYNNQSSSESDSDTSDTGAVPTNKRRKTQSSSSSSSSSDTEKQAIKKDFPNKTDSNKENKSLSKLDSKSMDISKHKKSSSRKSSKHKPSSDKHENEKSKSASIKELKSSKEKTDKSKSSKKSRSRKSSNQSDTDKSHKKSRRSGDEKSKRSRHSSDHEKSRSRRKSRRSRSSSSSSSSDSSSHKHSNKSDKKESKSSKSEVKSSSKKQKIKELNRKIEKATREVEKKARSKKHTARSTSSSSSSSERRKSKKKSVKSSRKRVSSTSSSSSSSSSSGSSGKHKSRKNKH